MPGVVEPRRDGVGSVARRGAGLSERAYSPDSGGWGEEGPAKAMTSRRRPRRKASITWLDRVTVAGGAAGPDLQ